MKTIIANDRPAMGQYVAEQAAAVLRKSLDSFDECNLVVATGSSQFEVLEKLIQQESIDWPRINGFHLDEYLGLPRDHSASFCGYLASRFVDKVPLRSFHFMEGTTPADQLKRVSDEVLGGRRVDLLLCGIGENGHLAFNDPPADFDATDPYLIVDLDEKCRKQQVGEGWFDGLADVPKQAISMSVNQILKASCILCAVPDRRKAEAVRATLEGGITPDVPASALKKHNDATLVLDADSSSLLSAQTQGSCERLA